MRRGPTNAMPDRPANPEARPTAGPFDGLGRRAFGRLLVAVQLFQAGDLGRALAELDAVVAEYPASGVANFLRAVLLTVAGDAAEALASVERAIAVGYGAAPAWLLRASLEADRGDEEQALLSAAQAVEADGQSGSAQLMLGHLRLRTGDADAAVESLRQAVRLTSQSAAARYRLAQALLAIGREDEAQAAVEAGLAAAPFDFRSRLTLGDLLDGRGATDGALAEFAAAAELPVRNVEAALAKLGKTRHELGDDEAAVADLQRAVEGNPKDYDSLVLLGSIALESGDLDDARRWLEVAIGVDATASEAAELLEIAHMKSPETRPADRVG